MKSKLMPTTRVKWANISGKVYKIESVDGLIDVNLADVQELFVMNTLVCKTKKRRHHNRQGEDIGCTRHFKCRSPTLYNTWVTRDFQTLLA